jgi:hypothetical protein
MEKTKKSYDVILSLPCEDEEIEEGEDSYVCVNMVVRFKSQRQFERLEDCGVFADCLEEFNQALSEGKGSYKRKTDKKRNLYVCDSGIELHDDLKDGHGKEIELDLSNK